jgi:hypothetical protein
LGVFAGNSVLGFGGGAYGLRLALEEYRRCRIKPRVKELKYWILQAVNNLSLKGEA